MPYLILIIMVIYLLSLLPDRKIVLSSGKNINLSISSMVLVVFFMPSIFKSSATMITNP